MLEQPVIMVLVEEPQWTKEVLQSACSLAQRAGGKVVLVKMLRVQYIAHLGSNLAYPPLTEEERRTLQGYADIAAGCGVACDLELYQYCDLFGAIEDAARAVGATTIFARLPQSRIPFWTDARFEVLRQHMEHQHQALYSSAAVMEQ